MESVETIYGFYENESSKYNLTPLETGEFIELMMEIYPSLVPDTEVVDGSLKPVYLNAELEHDEHLTVYDSDWEALTPEQSLKFYQEYSELEDLNHLKHFFVTLSDERKKYLPEIWRKTGLVAGYDSYYRDKVDIVNQWILETNIEANQIQKIDFGRKFGEQIPLSRTAKTLLKKKIQDGEIDSNTTVYELFNIEEISSDTGKKINVGVYDDEVTGYQKTKWKTKKTLGKIESMFTSEPEEPTVKPSDIERMDGQQMNQLIQESKRERSTETATNQNTEPKNTNQNPVGNGATNRDTSPRRETKTEDTETTDRKTETHNVSDDNVFSTNDENRRNHVRDNKNPTAPQEKPSTGGSHPNEDRNHDGEDGAEENYYHDGEDGAEENYRETDNIQDDGDKDGDEGVSGDSDRGEDVSDDGSHEPAIEIGDVKDTLMNQEFKKLQNQAEKHGVDKYGSREEMAEGIIENVDMNSLKKRMRERKKERGVI